MAENRLVILGEANDLRTLLAAPALPGSAQALRGNVLRSR